MALRLDTQSSHFKATDSAPRGLGKSAACCSLLVSNYLPCTQCFSCFVVLVIYINLQKIVGFAQTELMRIDKPPVASVSRWPVVGGRGVALKISSTAHVSALSSHASFFWWNTTLKESRLLPYTGKRVWTNNYS